MIVTLLVLATPSGAFSAGNRSASLFGSYESEIGRPDKVIERANVLQLAVKQAFLAPPTPVALQPQNAWAAWQQLLPQLSGQALWTQLVTIQNFINSVPYREDGEHFLTVRDEWQAPHAFLVQGGDCEEYAIAKYASLRRLGVPAERLRIVVANNLQRGTHHAFLAVLMDDDVLVLDNLTAGVVSHRQLPHYRPLYSLNEHKLWTHWYSGEMPPNVVMLDTVRPSGSLR